MKGKTLRVVASGELQCLVDDALQRGGPFGDAVEDPAFTEFGDRHDWLAGEEEGERPALPCGEDC